jgi:asparaginyl-tRNA synthetase
MATHQFFSNRGFYYLHSPIITAVDAEGAGEMFTVTSLKPQEIVQRKGDLSGDYFGKQAHLTVSGQLAGECFALGMGAVYTFGPTFRAENSNTARHLSEFWMIEPERAFMDLEGNAELAADYIKYLVNYAFDHCPEELKALSSYHQFQAKQENRPFEDHLAVLEQVRHSEFLKISYTDAMALLSKTGHKFEYPTDWGAEMQTEHERYLTEIEFKRPVIVTDYPKHTKAFYMKQNPDGKTVRAMDVLVPGVGEIIGGSQREDDYEKLLSRCNEMGMNASSIQWYLDLRRFGGAPHAGFGLGFERAIMYITGMKNIRDVIPFPRAPKDCEF